MFASPRSPSQMILFSILKRSTFPPWMFSLFWYVPGTLKPLRSWNNPLFIDHLHQFLLTTWSLSTWSSPWWQNCQHGASCWWHHGWQLTWVEAERARRLLSSHSDSVIWYRSTNFDIFRTELLFLPYYLIFLLIFPFTTHIQRWLFIFRGFWQNTGLWAWVHGYISMSQITFTKLKRVIFTKGKFWPPDPWWHWLVVFTRVCAHQQEVAPIVETMGEWKTSSTHQSLTFTNIQWIFTITLVGRWH